MVDETEYRATYQSVNQIPCPFERAILSARCRCELSQRIFIAEREAVACKDGGARDRCKQLLALLRDNARFALQLTHIDGPLPHGKEIKVQVGGMLGLQAVMHPGRASVGEVTNISELVLQAQEHFGALGNLPYQEIVKRVVSYSHRRKKS
jgi:hypothetical protein